MKDKNVIFRRIKGRIIPIRLTDQQAKDLRSGAAAAAAGVGVSLGAGKVYKEAVVRSARAAFRATDALTEMRSRLKSGAQLPLGDIAKIARKTRSAQRMLTFSKHASSAAGVLRKVQGPIGIGLLTYGLAKAGHALVSKQDKDKVGPAAFVAAGAISSASFLVGMHGKAGASHISSRAADFARTYAPKAKRALLAYLKAKVL